MSALPICVNCISGTELPGEPRGKMETVGPYSTYVSVPSKSDAASGKAIVSFTDLYGLKLKNAKIIADMLADHTGIAVYVPDLFHGQPIDPASLMVPSSAHEAANESLRTKITKMGKLISIVPWIYRNWPTSKYNDIETFLVALREGKSVQRIGAVGFCYGGKMAVDFNTKGLIEVTVASHPSFVNAASFADLKGPILLNCAESDDQFGIKVVEQVRAMLDNSAKAPEHDIKVMPGTAHSFAARPNLAVKEVKAGFEEATSRTAEWFKSKL